MRLVGVRHAGKWGFEFIAQVTGLVFDKFLICETSSFHIRFLRQAVNVKGALGKKGRLIFRVRIDAETIEHVRDTVAVGYARAQ